MISSDLLIYGDSYWIIWIYGDFMDSNQELLKMMMVY